MSAPGRTVTRASWTPTERLEVTTEDYFRLPVVARGQSSNKLNIAMSKRHHVSFIAHKKVPEEVQVEFRTKAGKKVSFDAEKRVKEAVRVDFMAKNKR